MARIRRLLKSFMKLLLPLVLLLLGAVIGASVWLVHQASMSPTKVYLITPSKYGQLSSRGAQVTEETWQNPDGTQSRGWLLRGSPGAPAVIFLHAYGADRSFVLNLGVKLSEATDFTVLMPDQRGHGNPPTVRSSSFGGCEAEDVISAIKFLRGLKADEQTPLVGPHVGLYGTEMGALVAVFTASKDENVRALLLDSVPGSSNDLLDTIIDKRFPFASSITSKFARLGTNFYFYDGCYRNDSVCETAKTIKNRQVLLLAGAENEKLRASTASLTKCFPPSTRVESKTDLNPAGYNIINASLEQSEAYDQRVIDFFKQALGN